MSPPTPDQVQVATRALHGDADVWTVQAQAMGTAAAQAGELAMTALESGMFVLISEVYQSVQTHVTARCAEGQQAMTRIADTLHTVARTYDLEEARHEHALRNLY